MVLGYTKAWPLFSHADPCNVPRRRVHFTHGETESLGPWGGERPAKCAGSLPAVILVCRLSLSTSTLFRSTAARATRM